MANLVRRTEGTTGQAWDPFDIMRELAGWDPLRARLGAFARESGFVPDFDVKETQQGFLFKADLPGFEEKDVDVTLSGNRLTVSGAREGEKAQESDRYYACERAFGSFSRSFTLPEGIDGDHVRAELRNGVLTLMIAKKPEHQPRKIPVQGQGQAKAVGVKA